MLYPQKGPNLFFLRSSDYTININKTWTMTPSANLANCPKSSPFIFCSRPWKCQHFDSVLHASPEFTVVNRVEKAGQFRGYETSRASHRGSSPKFTLHECQLSYPILGGISFGVPLEPRVRFLNLSSLWGLKKNQDPISIHFNHKQFAPMSAKQPSQRWLRWLQWGPHDMRSTFGGMVPPHFRENAESAKPHRLGIGGFGWSMLRINTPIPCKYTKCWIYIYIYIYPENHIAIFSCQNACF